MLLDFEKFDLIKLLCRNRLKIVWCNRMDLVEDQKERKIVEDETKMGEQPSLVAILEHFYVTRATVKE
jgi:pre-mRNA-splicing helicase BRR2